MKDSDTSGMEDNPEPSAYDNQVYSRKNHYDIVERMFMPSRRRPVIEKGDPPSNRQLDLERGHHSLALRS